MPRHNNQNQSKIRKRVSSSSSSCSAASKNNNYRLKKAILVGKSASATTTTPVAVPTWKVIMASPLNLVNYDNGVKNVEDGTSNNYNKDTDINIKGKEVMSARKLAATLWEINGSPFGLSQEYFFDDKEKKEKEKRGRYNSDTDPLTPVYDQKIDGSKVRGHGHSHRRRSSTTLQKFEITDYIAAAEGPEPLGKGKADSIEVAGVGKNSLIIKSRLKDVKNSLIASKELVKVLFRMISQDSSRITLVSALRVELDRARLQVEKLIQEQQLNWNEMDALLKQEKATWKSRERERIKEAVSSLARELEIERKLRRQAERLNNKLGMELADTRAQLSSATKELDGERRGREVLGQTCDELARGIGEERVEVEDLKRESAKAREELEKERQMLQLADALREERVQMKLAEARYDYEEKTAALERFKTEIAAYYLYLKKSTSGVPNKEADLQDLLTKMQTSPLQLQRQGEVNDNDDDAEEGDSELHSIELNMDNNNKSYRWSFACEGNNNQISESRRASTSTSMSMDEVFKGRRSLSDKVQWDTICLQRKTCSDGGIQWDFTNTKQGNATTTGLSLDKGRSSKVWQDEFIRKSASPPISTGNENSSRLREACSAILQDLASRSKQQYV